MQPIPLTYPLLLPAECFILSATALILSRSTLTGAFAYEFNFILGIVSSLVFCLSTAIRLAVVSQWRPILQRDILRAILSSQISLLTPILIIFAFSGRNPTCRYDIGWCWFFLLPFVSTFFGASCGIWAAPQPKPTWKLLLKALSPIFAFSLLTLRDLFFDPSLSFLHPAFGYFAGPIYDEWIPIERSVITYRCWTIALSLLLIWTTLLKIGNKEPWRNKFLLGSSLILLLTLVFRETMGWHYGKRALSKALQTTIQGSFLRLHHDVKSLSKEQAWNLIHTLDYRVSKIVKQLELGELSKKPIDVFIYPSGLVKKKITGTRYTSIGNPWQRALHILDTDPQSQIFPHELTHVIAAHFGVPLLGLSFRLGLLEGLATALERYRDDLSVHEWTKAMKLLGVLPDMEELFVPSGFWKQSASRAYLSAGSFCRWLIDLYGIDRFKQVYRGKSFETVYGIGLRELLRRWDIFLEKIPLSSQAIKIAELTLRAQPITERRCPHDVADSLEKGWSCMKTSNLVCASEAFGQARIFSGSSPFTLLKLAQFESRRQNWQKVKALSSEILQHPGSAMYHKAWAQMLTGDDWVIQKQYREARSHYETPTLKELEEFLKLSLLTRRSLIEINKFSILEDLIQKGFSKTWIQSLSESKLNENLLIYLSKLCLDHAELELAQDLLSQLKGKKLVELEGLRWKLVAQVSEAQGKFEEAIQSYKELEKNAKTFGLLLFCRDQIARIQFLLGKKQASALANKSDS